MSKKKIFYGWYLCLASLIMLIGGSGIMTNSASQFMKPVTSALGITRSQFSLYMSFMTISIMLISPFIGRIYKTFNPRKITIIAGIVMLSAWTSLSFATSLIHLYIAGLVLGLGLAFVGLVTANILMTNWFHEKKGVAMGIALTGTGIGSMIFNPVASYLIMTYGYQSAYRILALISIFFLIPIFLLYKYQPSDMGLKPYGMTTNKDTTKKSSLELSGIMYSDAVKSSKFWAICFISFGLSSSVMGLFTHTMPYLTDIGYDQMSAASLIGAMGLFLAFGKLFFGWVNDRLGIRTNFTIAVIIAIFSVIALYFAKNSIAASISTVLFGLALAVPFIISPLLTASVFGRKDFANIYGTITSFLFLGPTLAPPITGYIYDKSGNYDLAFAIYLIILVLVFTTGQFVLSTNNSKNKSKEEAI